MNITYIEKDKVLNALCTEDVLPEKMCPLSRISLLDKTGLNTSVV
jgi:hypothetical protein